MKDLKPVWKRLEVAERLNTALLILAIVLERSCSTPTERDQVLRTLEDRMRQLALPDVSGPVPDRWREEATAIVDTLIQLARSTASPPA